MIDLMRRVGESRRRHVNTRVDEALRRAVINTLGGRRPHAVGRYAGLPPNSIARMLEGTNPQLLTAIAVVRVFGFEFRYRWLWEKGRDHLVALRAMATLLSLKPEFREFWRSPHTR